MKLKLLFGVFLLGITGAATSGQAPCPASDQSPCLTQRPGLPDVPRGQYVTVAGEHLPPKNVQVHLTTDNADSKPVYNLDATVNPDGKTLTFLADVPRQDYLVSVTIDSNKLPFSSRLSVLPDSDAPVKLTAIHPVTQYPSATHGDYDLVFIGENFDRHAEDNLIEVVDRGPESVIFRGTYPNCKEAFAAQPAVGRRPCLQVPKGLETRELELVGFHPDKYSGPVKMQVRVGKNVSDPVTATMSRISSTAAFLLTLLVFFVLAWIVVKLVSKGVKPYRIGDKSYSPFTAFFLDKETNSFSLSKFQLLAWTAVSIFGYVYLFVCRMLVQWDFTFPPIPDNLPQLLAISAGTTVAATGITSTVGSKGAGPVQPSYADFISTGGLVVGERFQFFVWTLVGCLGFISLLLLKDPAAINELPKVPDGFLYLMGVSSAGYLGGKVVRKPGPVIKSLAITAVVPYGGNMPPIIPPAPPAPPAPAAPPIPKVLVINLKGENLGAENAKLQVDNRTFDRADDFWLRGAPNPQTNFCAEVYVGINDAGAKGYLEGEHVLTFINNDGQAASMTFPVDALKIESFAIEHPAGGALQLKVTGKNFVKQGMQIKWEPAAVGAAVAGPVDITEAQVISENELQVPLAGPLQNITGLGKLTIITTQFGLSANKEGTISAP